MEVKAVPVCIYCGKPFIEQKLPEYLLHLPTIGEKLRYVPQCDCYREALQKELSLIHICVRFYLIIKGNKQAVDLEAEREKIRAELLQEMAEKEKNADE